MISNAWCWLILTVRQALAAATGRQESLIKKQYDESGDLGTVASAARATQRTMFQPQPLTIPGVLKSVLPSHVCTQLYFMYADVHVSCTCLVLSCLVFICCAVLCCAVPCCIPFHSMSWVSFGASWGLFMWSHAVLHGLA